jgi:cell wall hydrolase/autolysin
MKVFINPGHDIKYDSGAVNNNYGITEAEIAKSVGEKVAYYLNQVGYATQVMQSDNLNYDSDYADRPYPVCVAANDWNSDLFVSIHCNAANTTAKGTETLVYNLGGQSEKLANCIQTQIIDSLNTVDRGLKVRPELTVLKRTDMPAVLVELAFIDNDEDANLLIERQEDFSKAIARGITDYVLSF